MSKFMLSMGKSVALCLALAAVGLRSGAAFWWNGTKWDFLYDLHK
jgi:hypothetical protein